MEGGEARFYLELAEALGKTEEELLGSISSAEITKWIVLWKLRAQEAKARANKR